ncbi:hypothetical protein HID58_024687 [Brassica napus]|uniref:ATP-dependent Clp protease proteolytic subunit n=1 Tax=Brassica napus TaxID=3708 RepID=A0ABQ8CIW8_BRANA|nr:hypothetical protein HID58_024687 [Brassica napus]
MSSSDVVAQSAFDVLRLGRSSQFIVARLLPSIHKLFDKWASEFEYELNPGISQCSSFGIGKASWSRVKMMPTEKEQMQSLIILLQYRERVIFNGQNIDEEFSNNILATMLYLDTLDDSRRIYMYLNGPGGDLTPSLASYDTMKSLKSFLLAAAEKHQWFAMPLLRIALQSPGGPALCIRTMHLAGPAAGAARGQLVQADDVQNEAKELSRIRDYLFN